LFQNSVNFGQVLGKTDFPLNPGKPGKQNLPLQKTEILEQLPMMIKNYQ
jgi:hypothetical protein